MKVHLQVEWVVQSNVILELVSQGRDVQDVINKFHDILLLIKGCCGGFNSDQTHRVVESNVHIAEELVFEEIPINDDLLGKN